jgi:drug/metabolite transporter (DMT)-like permease
MSPSPTGVLLALCSAALYGLSIAYARLASFEGVSGPTLVVYRVLLTLVLGALVAQALRRPLTIAPGERRLIGLLGVATALIGLCYLSSVSFIPVTVAVVVFYSFPIVIVLLSPFVDGSRLTPTLLGVVGLALIGVVLVVGPAVNGLDWRGLALAFLASLAAATQFFAAARCRRTGLFAKVFWIHVVVLPTSALIAVAAGSLAPPAILLLTPVAAAMTIGGYVIGFALQFLALGRIAAVAAGIAYCAEPVVAALSSTMILGERLSAVQIFGGALVLAAIVAHVTLDGRRAHTLVPRE